MNGSYRLENIGLNGSSTEFITNSLSYHNFLISFFEQSLQKMNMFIYDACAKPSAKIDISYYFADMEMNFTLGQLTEWIH